LIMRKVYMSFLGTTDYLPCTYLFDNILFRDIRFVQEATIKLSCIDWAATDNILIFTTSEAEQKNWKDNGHIEPKTGKILQRKGLSKSIGELGLSVPYKNIVIPIGKSEEEIWEIFKIVFDQLDQKDHIIFDITHAFRSIPMLAVVILNYAKIMKGITIQGIYYGALEVLGNIQDAKKFPSNKRLVPLLDLTYFDQLMEWSFAINRFIEAGDAAHISRLANYTARSHLSKTRGQGKAAHSLRRIAEYLNKFTKALSTCRGLDISDIAGRLNDAIKQLEDSEYMPPEPFQPVFEQIKNQVVQFNGNPVLDGIKAARWCLEHNLIQQGYTILQETLISYFISEIKQDQEDQKYREIVGQSVTIFLKQLPQSKWKKPSADSEEIVQKLLEVYKGQDKLLHTFRNISDDRNDLNHGGHKKDHRRAELFERHLSDMIAEVETHLKNQQR
jgi:CRISPR-associated Csx2 family protein